MSGTVAFVTYCALSISAVACFARLVQGPSLADRIVALDALLVVVVTGIAAHAALTGAGIYLDALVVASLLAFVGTVTVARFIERRGV